ncbi:MAG: hypothetical protein ACKVZ6_02265 [Kineosporiaceae bacterium]|jgi:hypothetical protein
MTAAAEDPHAHALLVVRAWGGRTGEPALSARVWATPDIGSTPPAVRVVRSAEDVVDAVRAWLALVVPPEDPPVAIRPLPPSA